MNHRASYIAHGSPIQVPIIGTSRWQRRLRTQVIVIMARKIQAAAFGSQAIKLPMFNNSCDRKGELKLKKVIYTATEESPHEMAAHSMRLIVVARGMVVMAMLLLGGGGFICYQQVPIHQVKSQTGSRSIEQKADWKRV